MRRRVPKDLPRSRHPKYIQGPRWPSDVSTLLSGSETPTKHKRLRGPITALHPASARSCTNTARPHSRDRTAESLKEKSEAALEARSTKWYTPPSDGAPEARSTKWYTPPGSGNQSRNSSRYSRSPPGRRSERQVTSLDESGMMRFSLQLVGIVGSGIPLSSLVGAVLLGVRTLDDENRLASPRGLGRSMLLILLVDHLSPPLNNCHSSFSLK